MNPDVITLEGLNLNAEEIAKQHGSLVENDAAKSLLKQWRSVAQSLKFHPKAIWKKEPPEVHVHIVANPKVNAFACPSDDGYAIVMFGGLIKALYDIFNALLADPRSHPAIGYSLGETASVEHKNVYNSLFDLLEDGVEQTPLDPYRGGFAAHMAELSLRFAFNHELYHVLLGHVDLIGESQPLFEFGPSCSASARNRAIEMHADECAFRNCIYWVLDSIEGVETEDPMTFYVNTIDAQMLDFFAATYTLFQLFDAMESGSHPNPVHRQARLCLILDYMVDFHKINLEHPATEIIGTVMNNVDLYMEEILGVNWDDRRKETERILTVDIKTEMAPYSVHVRDLYPKLEPLAYVDVR